jgi:hypothetical protein|tara:strand:- start:259 stop:441 length:183 start_codon:yes stop_codon:yes gene_type:complete
MTKLQIDLIAKAINRQLNASQNSLNPPQYHLVELAEDIARAIKKTYHGFDEEDFIKKSTE